MEVQRRLVDVAGENGQQFRRRKDLAMKLVGAGIVAVLRPGLTPFDLPIRVRRRAPLGMPAAKENGTPGDLQRHVHQQYQRLAQGGLRAKKITLRG